MGARDKSFMNRASSLPKLMLLNILEVGFLREGVMNCDDAVYEGAAEKGFSSFAGMRLTMLLTEPFFLKMEYVYCSI